MITMDINEMEGFPSE